MVAFQPTTFAAIIRGHSTTEVCLALTQVRTRAGAERIYQAERSGRGRRVILREAARRIAELGGTESTGHGPQLVIAAETVV